MAPDMHCLQYLDRYLWPNYKEGEASAQHVMSIAAMVVERARENVPAWACFAGAAPAGHHHALSQVQVHC